MSPPHTVVSGALVQEREICKEGGKLSQQGPIYFVFKALASSKKYYSEMEKICYDVVMSARKIHHYFKAHKVSVTPSFKAKTRCASYVCPKIICHTYGQNYSISE
jgi:hypothetical protein